jgi:hypothetical protein
VRRVIWRSRAFVVVTVLLAGCASTTGDATSTHDAPGTKLSAGYVVPSGSPLVGPVFPIAAASGTGSLALIDIERDPLGVYDDLVAQGRKAGTPLPGSGTAAPYEGPHTCHLDVDNHWAPIGPFDAAAATSVDCYGAGVLPDGAGSVVVQTSWGGSAHHALLETSDNPIAGGGRDDLGDARAPELVPLPKVADRPLVSEPGKPFGTSHNGFEAGYRQFTLEPGSRVVADVDGFTQGVFVVLRIDGDTRAVVTRYARQIGDGGTTPRVREVATPGGHILSVVNSPEGGGAVFLDTDPSGRWLLIRANSD